MDNVLAAAEHQMTVPAVVSFRGFSKLAELTPGEVVILPRQHCLTWNPHVNILMRTPCDKPTHACVEVLSYWVIMFNAVGAEAEQDE